MACEGQGHISTPGFYRIGDDPFSTPVVWTFEFWTTMVELPASEPYYAVDQSLSPDAYPPFLGKRSAVTIKRSGRPARTTVLGTCLNVD